jgi:hypothetical protein
MNEEIMQSFQSNMALIAGNSFEILQLFLMIQEEYALLTEKLEKTENSIETTSKKSVDLESKLTKMMQLI